MARENAALAILQAVGGLPAGVATDALGARLLAVAAADDDRYVVSYALRALVRLGRGTSTEGLVATTQRMQEQLVDARWCPMTDGAAPF